MTYTDINVEIILTPAYNKIKVTDFVAEETVEEQVSSVDFNEIQSDMQVPGFGLGMLLIKIGRAIGKAVGNGSSSE